MRSISKAAYAAVLLLAAGPALGGADVPAGIFPPGPYPPAPIYSPSPPPGYASSPQLYAPPTPPILPHLQIHRHAPPVAHPGERHWRRQEPAEPWYPDDRWEQRRMREGWRGR